MRLQPLHVVFIRWLLAQVPNHFRSHPLSSPSRTRRRLARRLEDGGASFEAVAQRSRKLNNSKGNEEGVEAPFMTRKHRIWPAASDYYHSAPNGKPTVSLYSSVCPDSGSKDVMFEWQGSRVDLQILPGIFITALCDKAAFLKSEVFVAMGAASALNAPN